MQRNLEASVLSDISDKGIKAKDLLPMLEKTNAFGIDRFKQLVSF